MSNQSTRRGFLATATAAVSMSAASYARVQGANERINIGIIGCGHRGLRAHMPGVHAHAEAQNIRIAAVSDPWRPRREEAAAQAGDWYGEKAKAYIAHEDLISDGGVDAVMIASCDHQHTRQLEDAAKAKLDVYCEKPLAMDFEKLKRACDAVKESAIVCQIGTQLRSLPAMRGTRELYKTGILGTVSRIEQCRNATEPYWYSRLQPAKKEDVDWPMFLMHRAPRPFDANLFTGWYGYRDFSDGPIPGLASHFIDLVHFITGAEFPTSAVCLGGTYTWDDDYHFTCPDHVQALWTYDEGFMVSYSTNFGNSAAKTCKILGDQGLVDMQNWNAPILTAEGGSKNKGVIRGENPVEEVPGPDHFEDWLQCIRNRKTPNASIDAGYQHAVAVIMAMRAFDTGQRQCYDARTRRIFAG